MWGNGQILIWQNKKTKEKKMDGKEKQQVFNDDDDD